ncbi:MAG: hypothetical protein IT428_32015, partial [Planctomycetaceae bacterium]|nr:hypothetical protein [Planctomycetaceae bacterium]
FCVDLVDGNSGEVIEDEQGFRNSFSFVASDANGWKHSTELVSAVNEQQTISATGTFGGGSTYTLTFDGQTTAAIAYDANAAAIQAAREALSNIASGDVAVTGGDLPTTPAVVTFQGRYAARSVPTMSVSLTLTSGSGVMTVDVTRPGSPAVPVFRTPSVLPPAVYFRIRIAIAVSNTASIYFDDVAMALMTALYVGGPMFAAFSPAAVEPAISAGGRPWAEGDSFTITVANDRAGLLQEWFHRNYNMASLGLLLPSDANGAETQLDSLIA